MSAFMIEQMVQNVMATAAIEGEKLDINEVRASVRKKFEKNKNNKEDK